ncbi:MAG: chloride channel protein [Planctomycetes bacterium]|nr:chloride channel protein [Planctomycetota bacterium]
MKRSGGSMILIFGEAVLGDLHRTILPVLAIGVAGAAVGFVYLSALRLLERGLGPEHTGPWVHLAIMTATGLVVGILMRVLGHTGNVELLVDDIHVLGGNREYRNLRSLIPVSLLCIASGGAAGPEAPLVQTTGSIGSWVAERWKMSMPDKRVLTITGMAAGFTVLFGAPLGAAIFALEILHRRGLEYYEAMLPATLGSLIGYAVWVLATGLGLTPVWQFPSAAALRPVDMAWALAAGVVGAAVAVAFTYTVAGLRKIFALMPAVMQPMVGGLALGGLAFWSHYALTFGELQINDVVAASPTVTLFLVAFTAKFIGTSTTVSSGWRGGFIIPLFFMGVALGRLWHLEMPATNEVVLIAGLMAGINTGVTKTPLGSTLVVTEMAGLQLLPTTLISAVVTLLLTSEVGLIDTQRSRGEAEHA